MPTGNWRRYYAAGRRGSETATEALSGLPGTPESALRLDIRRPVPLYTHPNLITCQDLRKIRLTIVTGGTVPAVPGSVNLATSLSESQISGTPTEAAGSWLFMVESWTVLADGERGQIACR